MTYCCFVYRAEAQTSGPGLGPSLHATGTRDLSLHGYCYNEAYCGQDLKPSLRHDYTYLHSLLFHRTATMNGLRMDELSAEVEVLESQVPLKC
jgi:hypothetical protein